MNMIELHAKTRIAFDALNREHRKAYATFMQNRAWGPNGCPFYAEWPDRDVITTIQKKLAAFAVSE